MPADNRKQTIRQQMISLLVNEVCGVREISQALSIPEKDIGDHLARQILKIYPAECLACGFVFKERQRFSRPGRCPRCRQTRISMPRFRILSQQGR